MGILKNISEWPQVINSRCKATARRSDPYSICTKFPRSTCSYLFRLEAVLKTLTRKSPNLHDYIVHSRWYSMVSLTVIRMPIVAQ